MGARLGRGEARHPSPRLPNASSPSAAVGFIKVVTPSGDFDCAFSATGFGSKAIRERPKTQAPPRGRGQIFGTTQATALSRNPPDRNRSPAACQAAPMS
jgi:hypothetical protein